MNLAEKDINEMDAEAKAFQKTVEEGQHKTQNRLNAILAALTTAALLLAANIAIGALGGLG